MDVLVTGPLSGSGTPRSRGPFTPYMPLPRCIAGPPFTCCPCSRPPLTSPLLQDPLREAIRSTCAHLKLACLLQCPVGGQHASPAGSCSSPWQALSFCLPHMVQMVRKPPPRGCRQGQGAWWHHVSTWSSAASRLVSGDPPQLSGPWFPFLRTQGKAWWCWGPGRLVPAGRLLAVTLPGPAAPETSRLFPEGSCPGCTDAPRLLGALDPGAPSQWRPT